MIGRDYRARVRLSTATDETLAEVGGTCARVPEASLPWLLAQGLVELVVPEVGLNVLQPSPVSIGIATIRAGEISREE